MKKFYFLLSGCKIMAEKYSLKLKYSLKYSLKLIYFMSDSSDFFYSLFHIQYNKAGNCYLFGINNNSIIRLFISQILTVISPWKKSSIFQSLGI